MLLKRIDALEAEKVRAEAQRAGLEGYVLKDSGGGARSYMLKPEHRSGEPPHWLCPGCYANRKKAMFQPQASLSQGRVYKCTSCNSPIILRAQPEWLD